MNIEGMMTEKSIKFSRMLGILKEISENFPDKRSERKNSYSMQDILLSAFSMFYIQCGSFLNFQRVMEENNNKNNAQNIFGIEKIPTDNHIRNILDDVPEDKLNSVFRKIFFNLNDIGIIDQYRDFDKQLLIAIDGTQVFSSNNIKCDKCCVTKHKSGSITYSHKVITPVIVKPNVSQVISLEPEYIVQQTPEDTKQDCELNAAKRWLDKHGAYYADKKVTILGDDLFSHQPFCEKLLNLRFNFIFTCKPDSHKIMYKMIDIYRNMQGVIKEKIIEKKIKNKKQIFNFKYLNKIRIKDGKDALLGNWCEVIVTDVSGKQIYKNSFVTSFTITDENIYEIVAAARARWKVENENNNTLKRHGYNLEHNFGHGKKNLSNLFSTLNMIAFLFHAVQEICSKNYQLARERIGARYAFFDEMRIITRLLLIQNWQELLLTMQGKIKYIPVFDTS